MRRCVEEQYCKFYKPGGSSLATVAGEEHFFVFFVDLFSAVANMRFFLFFLRWILLLMNKEIARHLHM